MIYAKFKKTIFIGIGVLIISALIFCLIPRTTVWNKKVCCYNLNAVDLSLSDDTRLEGMTDFIDIQCDFSISGPLFPSSLRGGSGTVSFNNSEYQVYSGNIEIDNNWLPMSLTGKKFEMNKQLYVSPNEKYIMLFCPLERSEAEGGNAVYWIGPCEDIGDLKAALNDFGLNYLIL